MFGLSKKERLTKTILNACVMQIPIYEESVKSFAAARSSEPAMTEQEVEQELIVIRRTYFYAVFDLICKPLHDSPRLKMLLQRALWAPSATGLPEEYTDDYFADYGIPAGPTFAIVYFCLTGKPVKERDYALLCSLNRYQSCLMDAALARINKEP